MRETYVWRDGEIVPKHSVSARQRVHVLSDDAVIKSQFDGKVYTSKARYRAEMKARGLIEVGNERREFEPKPYEPPSFEHDIRRVLSER